MEIFAPTTVAHFDTFARVRSVEFGRQWNLNQGVSTNAATSNAVKGQTKAFGGKLRMGKSANTYLEANSGNKFATTSFFQATVMRLAFNSISRSGQMYAIISSKSRAKDSTLAGVIG